jgi:hypothetical protein
MNIHEKNSKQPDETRTQAALQWLQAHREELSQFSGEYIAFNEHGVLAHHQELQTTLQSAKTTGQQYFIDIVRSNPDAVYILPIYIRSISNHQWSPKYPVRMVHKTHSLDVMMLVDSGTDFSLMPFSIGKDLGYSLADDEMTFQARTVAGSVPYVVRKIEMTINNHTFTAPIIWLQTEGTNELILGRELVFDLFNIEFRQAEETIIFTLHQTTKS